MKLLDIIITVFKLAVIIYAFAIVVAIMYIHWPI